MPLVRMTGAISHVAAPLAIPTLSQDDADARLPAWPSARRGLAPVGRKNDPSRHRTTIGETTMPSRRRLLRTGAATVAAAMIARMPRAFAATYDLVIKGGR